MFSPAGRITPRAAGKGVSLCIHTGCKGVICPGNGLSQLTEKQVAQLKESTPLLEEDMVKLLKRYGQYDETDKGTDGIPYNTMLTFPELQANPVMPRLLELYVNKGNQTLYAENFLYLFALLSKETPVNEKRAAAFRCFDMRGAGRLGHQDLYHMYTLLYRTSLSTDVILDLVDRTLSQPHLAEKGSLTQQEFNQMVSDWEVANLFTVELQIG